MNNKSLAYALDFTSFLMQSLDKKYLADIKEIVLFGSASRGTATKKSDIDIFIDVFRRRELDEKIQNVVEAFYESQKFKYWKLLYVENPIRCITGKLDEWENLKQSIISDGIVMYKKYEDVAGGKAFIIVYWRKIQPESKRVLLNKKLYGYAIHKKRYEGLSKEAEIQKLGSNCILVPLKYAKKVLDIFEKLEVDKRVIYMNKYE